MKDLILKLINEYGSDAIVSYSGVAYSTKVFFQLVTSKSWQNLERMVDTGGVIPRGQYLFIAPPELASKPVECLIVDGRAFTVRRAETILYRNERLFTWGLCVEGGGMDPWLT